MIARLGDERVENKTAYVYGFAKNVLFEAARRDRRQRPLDEASAAAADRTSAEAAEDDDAGRCLDECLDALPAANRLLILEYFSERKQAKIELHRELAAQLETTPTALRMRIVRIKRTLRGCLDKCRAA